MDNPVKESKILIGALDGKAFIISKGSMTANLSFPIREYLYHLIDVSSSQIEIYIDLSETDYMDSTFMGLLVGVEKKTTKKFNTHLKLINISDKSLQYLKNLHLDRLLDINEMTIPDNILFCVFNEEFLLTEKEKTQAVYDAHKSLSEICSDNERKFKTLQSLLENQLNDGDN